MVFETLYEASKKGELILVNGGLCHWHLRRNGQITIYEIIILPEDQRKGIGTLLLRMLKEVKGATSIFANCPAELPSNKWYEKMGFILESQNPTRNGTPLNQWRLIL